MYCACGSLRIIEVSGKTDDQCCVTDPHNNIDQVGYVPHNIGIGGGDYISFNYCADCGRIQNRCFPVSDSVLIEALG